MFFTRYAKIRIRKVETKPINKMKTINGFSILEHEDVILEPIQDFRQIKKERKLRNSRVTGFLLWMGGTIYLAWVISLF